MTNKQSRTNGESSTNIVARGNSNVHSWASHTMMTMMMILLANVTRMSLTCYEEIGCVGRVQEDVTRMLLYEKTAPVEFKLNKRRNDQKNVQ